MRSIRIMVRFIFHRVMNQRFLTFILAVFLILLNQMQGFRVYTQAKGHPITWCVFPFQLSNHVFLCAYWLGVIYLHSDAPFLQHYGMYQLIRLGKKKWVMLNLLTIIARSFAAACAVAVLSVAAVFPRVLWTNEWGKVMRTIAMTDALREYSLSFPVPHAILTEYSPLGLMGMTLLIVTLIGSFLGFLIYALAVVANRYVAIAAVTLYSFMMFLPLNAHPLFRPVLAKWTPTVWGMLVTMETPYMGILWFPTVRYMQIFLGTGILASGILIYWKSRRMEFDWINEDT